MKPEPTTGTQLLAASRATLTLRLPDGRVRTLALSREPLTIGRHPTNHLVIDVPTVSSEHASLEYRAGSYHLVDHGSRNGTFVNSQRIVEIDLKDGDLIRLGELGSNAVTLTYRAGQAPQSAAFSSIVSAQAAVAPAITGTLRAYLIVYYTGTMPSM